AARPVKNPHVVVQDAMAAYAQHAKLTVCELVVRLQVRAQGEARGAGADARRPKVRIAAWASGGVHGERLGIGCPRDAQPGKGDEACQDATAPTWPDGHMAFRESGFGHEQFSQCLRLSVIVTSQGNAAGTSARDSWPSRCVERARCADAPGSRCARAAARCAVFYPRRG